MLSESHLFFPEDATVYPLDLSEVTDVSITEVAATVAEGKKCIVNKKNQTIELEKLIDFEPFAYLGEAILRSLFSEENTKSKREHR